MPASAHPLRRSAFVALAIVVAVAPAACRRTHPHRVPGAGGPRLTPVRLAEDGRMEVAIDHRGFRPALITARPGQPVTLSFQRTADATCGDELRIPTLRITRDLPVGRHVDISFRAPPSGAVAFACGSEQTRGALTVD